MSKISFAIYNAISAKLSTFYFIIILGLSYASSEG